MTRGTFDIDSPERFHPPQVTRSASIITTFRQWHVRKDSLRSCINTAPRTVISLIEGDCSRLASTMLIGMHKDPGSAFGDLVRVVLRTLQTLAVIALFLTIVGQFSVVAYTPRRSAQVNLSELLRLS